MPHTSEEGKLSSGALGFLATVAAVAAALGVGAIWLLGTSSTVGCEYNEAREGGRYAMWEGLHLEDVRQLAKERELQITLEAEARSAVAPDTVIEISSCGVPRGTLLATVARDRR